MNVLRQPILLCGHCELGGLSSVSCRYIKGSCGLGPAVVGKPLSRSTCSHQSDRIAGFRGNQDHSLINLTMHCRLRYFLQSHNR